MLAALSSYNCQLSLKANTIKNTKVQEKDMLIMKKMVVVKTKNCYHKNKMYSEVCFRDSVIKLKGDDITA